MCGVTIPSPAYTYNKIKQKGEDLKVPSPLPPRQGVLRPVYRPFRVVSEIGAEEVQSLLPVDEALLCQVLLLEVPSFALLRLPMGLHVLKAFQEGYLVGLVFSFLYLWLRSRRGDFFFYHRWWGLDLGDFLVFR